MHRFKPQRLLPRPWRRRDRLHRERERACYWERAAHIAEVDRDFWRSIAEGRARQALLEKKRDWRPLWAVGGFVAGLAVAGLIAAVVKG
jgi:hypothetical protein